MSLLPVFKRTFFVEIKYHYNNGAKFKSTVEKFKQLSNYNVDLLLKVR